MKQVQSKQDFPQLLAGLIVLQPITRAWLSVDAMRIQFTQSDWSIFQPLQNFLLIFFPAGKGPLDKPVRMPPPAEG